jgi:hypothetical protein
MNAFSLQLTPHETIQVLEAEGSRLVLEVRYDPHGRPPPRHLHPAQVEDFEVLSGELDRHACWADTGHVPRDRRASPGRGTPNRLALARVVARYGDEFRLAGPAGRLLARLGH